MNPFRKPIQKLSEVWGAQRGRRARVLLYHSISDTPGDPLAVSPKLFRSQMKWLYENNIRVISSQDLILATQQSMDPAHSVVLTFDDGLQDFFDAALPVLQEFHFPAVIFVPTGQIGQVGDWGRSSPNRPVMDARQLIQAASLGLELGSHTVHHAKLADLDQAALDRELRESLEHLAGLSPQKAIPLAYPFGSAGLREQAAALSAGYACAYLASGLWGVGKGSQLFALPREPVQRNTGLREFSSIVRGKMDIRRVWNEFRERSLNSG